MMSWLISFECNFWGEQILVECMKEFDVTFASPMLSQLTSADALSDLLCKAATKEREPVCVQELPPNVHFE